MLNSTVIDKRTHNTNTNVTSNSYAANSVHHNSNDSFFVSFEWGSNVANRLMGNKPTYQIGTSYAAKFKPVQIIQMVTMLDRIVAEIRFIEE